MSKKRNSIEDFGVAEDVSNHLLYQSFLHIHEAANAAVANDIFGEKIWSIEPDSSWKSPPIPNNLADWLQCQDEIIDNAIDPKTATLLSDAWYSALDSALRSGRKLEKNRKLTSTTDIVSYSINLTVCLESVLNRYIFFLKETGQLPPEHYNMIDRSEIMPKLLFCFKDQISDGVIKINRIKQLVSMRNRSVHYRTDSYIALNPSIEDLIGIWNQVGSVFSLIPGEPSEEYLQYLVRKFVEQWIDYPKSAQKITLHSRIKRQIQHLIHSIQTIYQKRRQPQPRLPSRPNICKEKQQSPDISPAESYRNGTE
ncbi:MAG: hypothetical protein ACPGVO_00530 [Spirulinaceae cyanobacterium]